MKLANVFIIGAAKSGTTHLCNRLKDHSQIYLCDRKEPCFFSEDEEYNKGLEYYSSLFSKATEAHQVLIDGSTQYSRCTIFKDVPKRIFEAVPEAKFIYVMRHPIDRAFSHYTHRWLKEVHPGEPFRESFEEFVEHDGMCLDDSLYKLQIEKYLEYFSIDRFLFLLTEEMNADWEGTLRKIYQHTGLDFENLVNKDLDRSKDSNVTSQYRQVVARKGASKKLKNNSVVYFLGYLIPKSVREWLYQKFIVPTPFYQKELSNFTPKPMKPETRQKLIHFYEETINWVETVMGKDLRDWRK